MDSVKDMLLLLISSSIVSNSDKLWIQYVHHDPGICRIRRHGKLPWIDHCSSDLNLASRGAPWTEGLPYVDLFHRSDRNDAFQLGTKMYRDETAYHSKIQKVSKKGGSIIWHC